MSTKLDARQRKEIQDHKNRMARARGEAPAGKASMSVACMAAGAMAGLVAVAIWVLSGGAS